MNILDLSPMLESAAIASPKGSGGSDMAAKLIDILHELLVVDKTGGEIKDDPMSELAGMPGGSVWQK